MEKLKTNESQRKAYTKWNKNNPEKRKYIMYKSHAKTFINKLIDNKEDLEQFEQYLKDAKQRINKA